MFTIFQRLGVVCGLILGTSWAWSEEAKLEGEGGSLEGRPGVEATTEAEKQPAASSSSWRDSKFWSINLRTALELDSNVKLDDDATRKDDGRAVVNGTFKVKLPKVLDVSSSVHYSYYRDFYDDLDDFDLQGHTFGASLSRPVTGNIFAFLDYAFAYFYFDEDGYLQRHTVRPSFYWSQTQSLAGLLRFAWDNNDYLQVAQLSGDNYMVAFREYWFVGGSKDKYLYGEYALNYNKAVEDFESYSGHRFTAGGQIPLWWEVKGRGEFSYSNNSYKQGDPRFADEFRSDNTFRCNVNFSRPVYRDIVSMGVFYRYTRQRSTLEARDYHNNVVGIELVAKL